MPTNIDPFVQTIFDTVFAIQPRYRYGMSWKIHPDDAKALAGKHAPTGTPYLDGQRGTLIGYPVVLDKTVERGTVEPVLPQ